MVIKALLNAWHGERVMRQMYDQLLGMIEAGERMFQTTIQVLFEGVDPKDVLSDLYGTDVRINKTERKIRKEIVEHLSIRPGGDVPACLVLMSVIKDAERIGDYCKNMFEIRDILGKGFGEDAIVREVREIQGRVLETFENTKTALRDGDESLAYKIIGQEKALGHRLDEMVREVAESELSVHEAVCRALCIRHMKRVHAHLCNIASSVVQPVHRLDYLDSKPLKTGGDEKRGA